MIDPALSDKRPFFADLWRKHHFDIQGLALSLGIPEQIILSMLRKQPVARSEAEQVLAKLSSAYKQDYRLSTVRVVLIEE